MQPKRDCCLHAATIRLLPQCSNNKTVPSMQPQRDCCLDAAETRLLPRCRKNETVASMQHERACCHDGATTKGLVRCSHNEMKPKSLEAAKRDWLDASRARCNAALTNLQPPFNHNEGVGSMKPQRDCCLDATPTRLLAR